MGLHNFIKLNPGNEEDIYYTPINIPDDGGILNMQSTLAQMKSMSDRMAAETWEDYQIYLAH